MAKTEFIQLQNTKRAPSPRFGVDVPLWRSVLYAAIGIAALSAVAAHTSETSLIWAALIAVPLLVAIMLGAVRLATSPWAKRNLGIIFGVFIFLQVIRLIFEIFLPPTR